MNGIARARGTNRGAFAFLLATLVAMALALPMAAPVDAKPLRETDGLWVGTIDLPGFRRGVALALSERADGRIVGYIVGGTGERTVVSGRRIDRSVTIAIEMRTPAATRLVTIDGKLAGHAIRGSAAVGTASAKIALTQLPQIVHERRFLVAHPLVSGEPGLIAEIAVALDGAGTVVAGGWVGFACDVWGCDGDVTAFREGAGMLTVGFRGDDPCSAGSEMTVTIDPATKIYSGSYRLNTCAGPVVAPVIAVRTTRTRSDHVGQVLDALGALADGLEDGAPLAPPHSSFSPSYADSRLDLDGLLERYNAEKLAYRDIEATYRRVSLVTTVPEPETPLDITPFGALFDELRSGVPSGGSTRVTYVDSTEGWMAPRLRVWAEEGGRWVVRGNGIPPLDLPFAYTIGTNALEVPFGDGSAGGTIHVSLGSYGAHFAPLTGHAAGNGKADLVGFFSASDADLTPVPDTGQLAYYDPTRGAQMLARRPLYIAPEDATMVGLSCIPAFTHPLGGEPFQWEVALRLANGELLRIGHAGKIAAGLRARLAAAGLPATCTFADGRNLLGAATLPVTRGEALAYPQVNANEVAAGYFTGGSGFYDRPAAQMEFGLAVFDGEHGELGSDGCYYELLPTRTRRAMQRVLDTDMADPQSQRYRSTTRFQRWSWQAEGRLCMARWRLPNDFSDFYTDLGGWYEKDVPGSIASDEIVAFAPIATNVATYDPTNYAPGVTMLILRQHAVPAMFSWTLPGTALIVSTRMVVGEIVERGPDSLLVRWRGAWLPTDASDVYQRAAYILDAVTGLKIHWGGNLALTAAAAALPTLSPDTPCDGTMVVCYDHTYQPGY